MSFLQLENKTFIVFGVANRSSVAYSIAKHMEEEGAEVIYVVRSQKRYEELTSKLLNGKTVFICDVENQKEIDQLTKNISQCYQIIDGIAHCIAFAQYSQGMSPFHSTTRQDFLQAMDISCFSFITIIDSLKDLLSPTASIIAISISTTTMASENYGYMAPIKAALDSSVVFLAKSLSIEVGRHIRVNAVGASLLKTSASAGIPNYINNYLFAEKVIPRQQALQTNEVAKIALFLLSSSSSGINAQTLIVDAGMNINYFDKDIVNKVTR